MAVRESSPLLADAAVTVIVPLPDPEAGETVSHPALSVTLQLILDDILRIPFAPASGPRLRSPGVAVK